MRMLAISILSEGEPLFTSIWCRRRFFY